jgi:hypothetical protein
MEAQSQPGQIVLKTLSRENPSQKWACGVTQSVGPDFKPQDNNNKKKRRQKKNIAVDIISN